MFNNVCMNSVSRGVGGRLDRNGTSESGNMYVSSPAGPWSSPELRKTYACRLSRSPQLLKLMIMHAGTELQKRTGTFPSKSVHHIRTSLAGRPALPHGTIMSQHPPEEPITPIVLCNRFATWQQAPQNTAFAPTIKPLLSAWGQHCRGNPISESIILQYQLSGSGVPSVGGMFFQNHFCQNPYLGLAPALQGTYNCRDPFLP
jgi:hypothetical protein